MDYAFKIVVSLIPVGLFFVYYVRNFVFQRNVYFLVRAFFFGMLMSGGALIIQILLPKTSSHFVRAFVHAALVEEVLRYGIILAMVHKSDDSFTVTEGLFRGVLVGLGFALAENMHYALNYRSFVILLRTVSSVPMHVFASGIMGYFIAYAYHCRLPVIEDSISRRRMRAMLFVALVLPLAFHTLFDFALFTGGRWLYVLPGLLTGGFVYVEYLNARARLVVPRNVLNVLRVDADDMELITRQRHYEAWLKERQQDSEPPPQIFRDRSNPRHLAIGLGLLLVAAAGTFVLRTRPDLLQLDASLSITVLSTLLMYLPGTAGIVLLVSDRLNYLFFRENLLRLPRVSMVILRQQETNLDTVVLDILPHGVFLADVHEIKRGSEVMLEFRGRPGRQAQVPGTVRWSNDIEPNLPRGSVVRYNRRPWAFTVYLAKHRLKRYRMGWSLVLSGATARPPPDPSGEESSRSWLFQRVRPGSKPIGLAADGPAHLRSRPAESHQEETHRLELRISAALDSEFLGREDVLQAEVRRTLAGLAEERSLDIPLLHVERTSDERNRTITLVHRGRVLVECQVPPGELIATEVPGFGSPLDATDKARRVAGTDLFFIPAAERDSVEGMGCEVEDDLAGMIALVTRAVVEHNAEEFYSMEAVLRVLGDLKRRSPERHARLVKRLELGTIQRVLGRTHNDAAAADVGEDLLLRGLEGESRRTRDVAELSRRVVLVASVAKRVLTVGRAPEDEQLGPGEGSDPTRNLIGELERLLHGSADSKTARRAALAARALLSYVVRLRRVLQQQVRDVESQVEWAGTPAEKRQVAERAGEELDLFIRASGDITKRYWRQIAHRLKSHTGPEKKEAAAVVRTVHSGIQRVFAEMGSLRSALEEGE